MASTWISKTLVHSGVVDHVVCGHFIAAQAEQCQVVLSHAGSGLELLAVEPSGAAVSIFMQPLQRGDVVQDMRVLRGGIDASHPAAPTTTATACCHPASGAAVGPPADLLAVLLGSGRLTLLGYDAECNRFQSLQEVLLVPPGTPPRFMPRLLAVGSSGRLGLAAAAFQDHILYLPPAAAAGVAAAGAAVKETAVAGAAATGTQSKAAEAMAPVDTAMAEGEEEEQGEAAAAAAASQAGDGTTAAHVAASGSAGGGMAEGAMQRSSSSVPVLLLGPPVAYQHHPRHPHQREAGHSCRLGSSAGSGRPEAGGGAAAADGDAPPEPRLTAGPVPGAPPRNLRRATAEALAAGVGSDPRVTTSGGFGGFQVSPSVLPLPLEPGCGAIWDMAILEGPGGSAAAAGGAVRGRRSSGKDEGVKEAAEVAVEAAGDGAALDVGGVRIAVLVQRSSCGAGEVLLLRWSRSAALLQCCLVLRLGGLERAGAGLGVESGSGSGGGRAPLGSPHLLRATPPLPQQQRQQQQRKEQGGLSPDASGLMVLGTHGALFLQTALLLQHSAAGTHTHTQDTNLAPRSPTHAGSGDATDLDAAAASAAPEPAAAGGAGDGGGAASAAVPPALPASQLPPPPPPVLYLGDLLASCGAGEEEGTAAQRGDAGTTRGTPAARSGGSGGAAGGSGAAGGIGSKGTATRFFSGLHQEELATGRVTSRRRHQQQQASNSGRFPSAATGRGWSYLRFSDLHFSAAAAAAAAAVAAATTGTTATGHGSEAAAAGWPGSAEEALGGGTAANMDMDVEVDMEVDEDADDGAAAAAGPRRGSSSRAAGRSSRGSTPRDAMGGEGGAAVAAGGAGGGGGLSLLLRRYGFGSHRRSGEVSGYRPPGRPFGSGSSSRDGAGPSSGFTRHHHHHQLPYPQRQQQRRGDEDRDADGLWQAFARPLSAAGTFRRAGAGAGAGGGRGGAHTMELDWRQLGGAGLYDHEPYDTEAVVHEMLVPLLEEQDIRGGQPLQPLQQAAPVMGVERMPLPQPSQPGHILTAAEWLPPAPTGHIGGGGGRAGSSKSPASDPQSRTSHGSACRRLMVCSAGGAALCLTVGVMMAQAAEGAEAAAATAFDAGMTSAAATGADGDGDASMRLAQAEDEDVCMGEVGGTAVAHAVGLSDGGGGGGKESQLCRVQLNAVPCSLPGAAAAAAAVAVARAAAVAGVTDGAGIGGGPLLRPARALAVLPPPQCCSRRRTRGMLVWAEEGGDVVIVRHKQRGLQQPASDQQQQQQQRRGLKPVRQTEDVAAVGSAAAAAAAPRPRRTVSAGQPSGAAGVRGGSVSLNGGGRLLSGPADSASAACARPPGSVAVRLGGAILANMEVDERLRLPPPSRLTGVAGVAGRPGLAAAAAAGPSAPSLPPSLPEAAAAAAAAVLSLRVLWRTAQPRPMVDFVVSEAAAGVQGRARALQVTGAILDLPGVAGASGGTADWPASLEGLPGRSGRSGGPPLQVLRTCLAAPVLARVPGQGDTPTGVWSIPLHQQPLHHHHHHPSHPPGTSAPPHAPYPPAGHTPATPAASSSSSAAAPPGGSLVVMSFLGGSRALAPYLDLPPAAGAGTAEGGGGGELEAGAAPSPAASVAGAAAGPAAAGAAAAAPAVPPRPCLRDVSEALQLRCWEPTLVAG
ncbi:hypothetical protein Agub_g1298, partial [Astrephomene gubernaculifera]